jgi:hypothetical protein
LATWRTVIDALYQCIQSSQGKKNVVEIHLYGRLRRYARDPKKGRGAVAVLARGGDETIASLLENVGIPVDEVNHIFLNAKLLATRTLAAPFMGYLQARSDPFDWDLNIPVDDGDRLGLFGRDMPILGM